MALVLFIAGSPRKKGSSERLLNLFRNEMEDRTIVSKILNVNDLTISGCQACGFCEENGFCRIKDDMEKVYPLLRESDLIVISTPVFFYHVPAQLKALIDRTQALWARRYRFGLKDPKAEKRKAFIIAVGATRGQNLFLGIELTAKYFLDALGAKLIGFFGVKKVEKPSDLDSMPDSINELRQRAKELRESLTNRKRILFLCRENASRSQMAEAFLQLYSPEGYEVLSAGDSPASQVNPNAVAVMQELGIDIMYNRPKHLQELRDLFPFDLAITMGCEISCPHISARKIEEWKIDDPSGKPIEDFRQVREKVNLKIKDLLNVITSGGYDTDLQKREGSKD